MDMILRAGEGYHRENEVWVANKKATVYEVYQDEEGLFYPSMASNEKKMTGFTFGTGKKLYWYCVAAKNGWKCYPVEDNGKIGWPRYCHGSTIVTVHFHIKSSLP